MISQHLYTKADLPTSPMRYGIGLLWNCSRKVPLPGTFNVNGVDLIYHSIVEINISIQVACMPACASCFRHFSPKLQTFFATRFLGTKTSDECSIHNEPEITENVDEPKWHHASRDWRPRDWRGKDDGVPQTTSFAQKSTEKFSIGNFTVVESHAVQETDNPMPKRPDSCFQGPQRLAQSEDRV